MAVHITYSNNNEKLFITNKGEYHGSGISILLDEITEKDIMILLDIKRESLDK